MAIENPGLRLVFPTDSLDVFNPSDLTVYKDVFESPLRKIPTLGYAHVYGNRDYMPDGRKALHITAQEVELGKEGDFRNRALYELNVVLEGLRQGWNIECRMYLANSPLTLKSQSGTDDGKAMFLDWTNKRGTFYRPFTDKDPLSLTNVKFSFHVHLDIT